MLESILPMLYINRAASGNVNSRSANQPQAQSVQRRRPKAAPEKEIATASAGHDRPEAIACEDEDPESVCQRYARSKKVGSARPKSGNSVNTIV